jgi:pimeloyl-ACP methyl ester carboxylesterase
MTTASDVAVTRREVAFRGGAVQVLEAGSGPVVGYLHGMVGLPAAGLPPLMAELAHDRRVIAPALPGFSGSSYVDGLRVQADWVVALSEIVDLVGLTGAPLVASSIGAMLAMELAAVRPEAFSQLVLLAPMGLWDAEDPVADAFGTTISEQRSLLSPNRASTAAVFDADPSVEDPHEQIEQGVSRYLSRTAAASLVWPIPEHGLAERAHLIRCPVTLVWGGDDRLVPASYAGRFAALLPNVVGDHRIDGVGHLVDWDAGAEVAAIARTAMT